MRRSLGGHICQCPSSSHGILSHYKQELVFISQQMTYLARVFPIFLGAYGGLWLWLRLPADASIRPRAFRVREDLQLCGLKERRGLPVLAQVAPARHGGLGAGGKLLVLRR